MKLLAYDRHDEFVARDYPGDEARRLRLVGVERRFDSGYYDIHRCFGANALRPETVALTYLPEQFKISDPLIARYAAEIAAELRKHGRLYDGPTVMRLHDLRLSGSSPEAVVQEASYPDQAGSSFALDYEHPAFAAWGGTLRNYYVASYPDRRYSRNPLGICLGVCGMLVVTEPDGQYMLLVERSAKLASLENTVGPSMAGAVDYTTGSETLAELMLSSADNEIEEEIGLKRREYTTTPLAVACEIFRGDRPQLFVLVETKLARREIEERLLTVAGREEFDRFGFYRLGNGRLDDEAIGRMNFEARMSYYLAEELIAQERVR